MQGDWDWHYENSNVQWHRKNFAGSEYVPNLKRNLILLGMLDHIGCSFKAKNGSLKVVKGSLVILKGVKMNVLYILDGRIIVGNVSNVQKQCINKTRMWHMRLRHISERGLQELVRRSC